MSVSSSSSSSRPSALDSADSPGSSRSPSRRAPLVYATRRSTLALAQCRAFVSRLRETDPSLDLQELQVVTSGDRIQDRPLSEIGGKGLFVKEIEEALLDGRAHFAVHSIKDVPGLLPSGLVITCIPKREDARDVLVAPRHGTLAQLPAGARVGTSSLRRSLSLKASRPDLDIVPMRGNVDTRLRKVDAGECDAIVLAHAGLVRLGIGVRATEILSPDVSLPAPGQGALGIECREGDGATRALLSKLHDVNAALCVAAERGVLIALGGDCKTPLGAFAERTQSGMRIRAFVANPDGSNAKQVDETQAWPTDEASAHDAGLAAGRRLGFAQNAVLR
jgi:hydroxymethylbilane synthase